MKLRLLDTFAGIGGFSLGLEATGFFETVAFCEIEEYPRRVLAKHWPDVYCHDDIRTLRYTRESDDPNDWILYDEKADHEITRGPVDVISGGFPCQDLSVAGKGAGIEGKRSGLWSNLARLIGEVRPRYAIVENVTALLSGDHGRWFGRVLGDLAALGYSAEWHCIPAASIGAPHRRDRVWIIAYPERPGEPAGAGNDRRNEGGPGPDSRAPLSPGAEVAQPADALADRSHLGGVPDADRSRSQGARRGKLQPTQRPRQSRQALADAEGPKVWSGSEKIDPREKEPSIGPRERGDAMADADGLNKSEEREGDGTQHEQRPAKRRREQLAAGPRTSRRTGRGPAPAGNERQGVREIPEIMADAEGRGLESSRRPSDASLQREDRPKDPHDRGSEVADADGGRLEGERLEEHRTIESSRRHESHGRGPGRRREGPDVADTDEKREPGLSIGTASEHASTSQRREGLADAGSTRGEAGLPGQDPRQEGQPRIPLYESHRRGRWPTGDFWTVEPDVGRVAHGVPARVDRLKCLGNAIVPDIAQLIGYAIADHAGLLR